MSAIEKFANATTPEDLADAVMDVSNLYDLKVVRDMIEREIKVREARKIGKELCEHCEQAFYPSELRTRYGSELSYLCASCWKEQEESDHQSSLADAEAERRNEAYFERNVDTSYIGSEEERLDRDYEDLVSRSQE